jgi:hypothetical protein
MRTKAVAKSPKRRGQPRHQDDTNPPGIGLFRPTASPALGRTPRRKALLGKNGAPVPGDSGTPPKFLSNSIGELCAHDYNAGG